MRRQPNPPVKFTARIINNLPTGDKPQSWHDTEIKELGVLVQPTGHKSYFMFFRVERGKPGKWITLGIATGITEHSTAIIAAIDRLPYLHAAAGGRLQVNIPTITANLPRGTTHPAHRGAAHQRAAPVIHIQHAVFNNQADLKKLMNRADFLIQHQRTAG